MIGGRSVIFGACLALALYGCGTDSDSDSSSGSGQEAGSTTTQPISPVSGGGTGGLSNLFFLHHSVGDGLVVGGDMRSAVNDYNAQHGTSLTFWDHGYNWEGLRNPNGDYTGTSYEIPDDNTDVEGLFLLWTSGDGQYVACRNQILANHHLIAFKSCFPNSAIPDSGTLDQYRQWYLAMRDFFDSHRERVFVVMSTPPLHRLETNAQEAANARAFANWLCSASYLDGHSNVACFDLFDRLAAPDDGSARANRLRWEYEMDHNDSDSHPNDQANQTVGPILAEFLCQVATSY
jgi:hypothetical protein